MNRVADNMASTIDRKAEQGARKAFRASIATEARGALLAFLGERPGYERECVRAWIDEVREIGVTVLGPDEANTALGAAAGRCGAQIVRGRAVVAWPGEAA